MEGQSWLCDLQNRPLVRGSAALILGLLLLLHTFGYLEKGITVLIVLCALGLIGYGLMLMGAWSSLKGLLKRKKE